MAGTDEAREHALGLEHVARALALSKSANWNQNEADWRSMLEIGHGWGLSFADGTLAASTLVLPYGDFAWISMVLVLPECRRRGYASKLLGTAIVDLRQRGLTPILDATPAGRLVYAQEGFRDAWGFKRLALSAAPKLSSENDACVRPLQDVDWPAILQFDLKAFGASREPLLRALAQRLPQAALVAERAGTLVGFLLGRDGLEACQLGPLVACDAGAARGLVAGALASVAAPLYIDIVDRDPVLIAWAESLGFVFQRPFTRMVLGPGRAPGDAHCVTLVAGPELG
jgi:GNAT superfamily N-acetyltransferase